MKPVFIFILMRLRKLKNRWLIYRPPGTKVLSFVISWFQFYFTQCTPGQDYSRNYLKSDPFKKFVALDTCSWPVSQRSNWSVERGFRVWRGLEVRFPIPPPPPCRAPNRASFALTGTYAALALPPT